MNPAEMLRGIDAISRDRNVDKESLFVDLEQAMVSAARKHFNALETEDFSCTIDRLNGETHLFRAEEEISLEALGRIPAQTAKQVMIQRFREDERTSIFNEFVERVGELSTGMAQRYEGGALVVQIGRAEGFMPRSEQIPGEQHQPGERVRCLILDVRDTGNQVKIVLSRAHADFIRRLFEVEVPEVAERIIEIKAMAREAGHRTKVSVSSIDSKVDAVGACVGVRGSRIKNIVDELGGEKIDIVRWNESSQILIQNALKPAEVREISLCFELGRATVVVDEDQLSLAIGKRGQNVRLAARLTNWDIDILTPAEFTKSLDTLDECLRQVESVAEEQIDRLAALGVISVFDVEEVGAEFLVESLEVTAEQGEEMVTVAVERAKVVAVEQQREREEAERRKQEEGEAVEAATPGEQQAAAVMGILDDDGGDDQGAQPAAEAGGDEQGVGSIVEMLETKHAQTDEAAAAPAAVELPAPAAATGEAGSEENADADDVFEEESAFEDREPQETADETNATSDVADVAEADDASSADASGDLQEQAAGDRPEQN